MNGQISNHSRFTTALCDVYLKKIRLNFCVMALIGLVLAVADNVRADDLHVPADYATIQAAVDAAASGDTIHVAPGVYVEQTTITGKDLTLIGQPGTILRANADMALSFPDYNKNLTSIVTVLQADVTVSGLTFEGERLGDIKVWELGGINFLSASGRVEDCRFTGFRGSTIGSNSLCHGIWARNPVSLGTDIVDIQVLRCTFADNARSIDLEGDGTSTGQPTKDPTLLRTTISVCDNTIIGNGPDPTGQQFGIAIWEGVGGEVKRNIITNHSWVDLTAVPPAVSLGLQANGFLAPLQPLHIEENIFRNNQVHCALFYADGSVVINNTFEGTAPGAIPVGLGISGENVLVSSNRFSDMERGIVLLGDDPDFGTSLGIASNATLVDNGFCNVGTNYDFQPLATYD
ncbi:MAG: right-handed parallel beta-helix repeat-containing protein, partial [Planctomycetota bacterium]